MVFSKLLFSSSELVLIERWKINNNDHFHHQMIQNIRTVSVARNLDIRQELVKGARECLTEL